MTSKDTEAAYAFWSSPDQSVTINYSLEVFHEIDFQVTEGYRRIPHGGIEVGGLLFGRTDGEAIHVQASRPIACEHATGPSFKLSERDLEELGQQIENYGSDPDLAGLEIVGWFVAHTRTPLHMTDREAAIFDRFFPGRRQFTLLVRPERFQATKFAFLVRDADGRVERDGTTDAIILPLPGRPGRGGESPVASIAAPAQKPLAPAPALADETEDEYEPEGPSLSVPVPPGPNESGDVPPIRAGLSSIRPEVRPLPPSSPEESENDATTVLTTIPREADLPSISEIKRRRSTRGGKAELERDGASYTARLFMILFAAAALGCGVGYWAYRQLPSPIVPVTIQAANSSVVVTWPAEQTREAVYAAIRVNDGAQQPLSPEERNAGALRISSPGSNIKIELIVQHWLRDSRGIVRYLSAAPVAATSEQPQPAR